MSNEGDFQRDLIQRIELMFPGALVLKNDPTYLQGIPDLSVFYKDRWATIEDKRSAHALHQPNQDYYVDLMNRMSFSAFAFPENMEEVLDALQRTFRARR